MTKFFAYENCTFPQINALERDTPLVIPLGSGFDLDRLASAFSRPPSIGLLPEIPFGWRGSGLPVPEQILRTLLINLVESLRQDGFSRVHVLTAQEIGLELGPAGISLPNDVQHYPTSYLPPDETRDKVILIPIGHTEQHAHHMTMNTDTLIIEAIAKGTAAALPEKAFDLPVTPYGVSTHRQSFGGTLNCGGRAFEDFWVAVVDVLAGRGFDRIYLINGHGGNHSYLVNVVKSSGERHPRAFIATAYLYLSGEEGVRSLQTLRTSPIGGMGHACELETSLMLHLRPELVHLEQAIDEVDFIATPNYYMDWVEGGALIANPPWDDDTQTGAYGAGSLGTAEKGRQWLEAAIAEKAAHVLEIHEQQERREKRRRSGFGLWAASRKN